MSKQQISVPASLMEMLASKDGMIRQKARKSLVILGKPVVASLSRLLLSSGSKQVRWEAAKALGAIGDVRAIPQLVKALEDSDYDVAWLAGCALKKLKKTAWPELLHALIEDDSCSFLLHKGAYHVFHNQKEEGFNDLLSTLTKNLESNAGLDATIVTAYELLERMKENHE